MNTPPVVRRHRIWPWIVAGCLAPWLALAAIAWSVVTPANELAVLRKGMTGDHALDWQTQIQLDLGPATLGLARAVVSVIQHEDIDKAKAALAAVRRASICVYSRRGAGDYHADLNSVAAAEAELESRGWEKVIKVSDPDNIVLVYHGEALGKSGEFCIAVLDEEQCVLVYAKLAADELAQVLALARGTILADARF